MKRKVVFMLAAILAQPVLVILNYIKNDIKVACDVRHILFVYI
jgi:hypothetical protein